MSRSTRAAVGEATLAPDARKLAVLGLRSLAAAIAIPAAIHGQAVPAQGRHVCMAAGVVRDALSLVPISGVNILLVARSTARLLGTAQSRGDGQFSIRGDAGDDRACSIVVTAIGRTQNRLEITADSGNSVSILMQVTAPQRLARVQILGEPRVYWTRDLEDESIRPGQFLQIGTAGSMGAGGDRNDVLSALGRSSSVRRTAEVLSSAAHELARRN